MHTPGLRDCHILSYKFLFFFIEEMFLCFLSLSRLVEGCPLASLRAGPESVANVHVQNLMVSITKPLYMECT